MLTIDTTGQEIYRCRISPIMRLKSIIAITIAAGPQIGASTHHHDQEMTLHNLSVIKIKLRIARNGKPPDVVFWRFAIIVWFYWFGSAYGIWTRDLRRDRATSTPDWTNALCCMGDRARTCDIYIPNVALHQLSYTHILQVVKESNLRRMVLETIAWPLGQRLVYLRVWWESNPRPDD